MNWSPDLTGHSGCHGIFVQKSDATPHPGHWSRPSGMMAGNEYKMVGGRLEANYSRNVTLVFLKGE